MKSQGIIKKYKYSKIFLIILLPILFYGYYSLPYITNSFLWRDINFNSIKIDDSNNIYRLENGILYGAGRTKKIEFTLNPKELMENDKILRIILFAQDTKERPFFMAPGVDSEELEASVEKLSVVHSDLLETKNMKSNVIPINFLKELPKIIKTNKNFLGGVSSAEAKKLIAQNKQTLGVYKNEITSIKKTLLNINLPKEHFVFNQASAVTGRDIILSDLSLMEENQKKIETEIKNTENCLNFSILFCSRDISLRPNAYKPNPSPPNVEIIGEDQIYYQQYRELNRVYGPYEVNTYCWYTPNKDKTKRYVYLIEKEFEGKKKKMPILATELYFHKANAENIGKVLESQYRKHGIEWEAGRLGTTYTCNDLEYHVNISTLDSYYRKFKDKDILNFKDEELVLYSDKFKSQIIKGQELEKEFFSQKFPSDNTLNSLGVAYRNIYSQIILLENEQSKPSDLIVDKKEELLYRSNFISGKLADFDRVINLNSQTLNGFVQIDKIIKEENNNTDYIYYMRNGYSLYYLNFSDSVWFLSSKPQYVDIENSQMRPDYIEYKDMVKRFGEEYVKKIISVSRDQVWQEVLGYPVE